MSLFDRHSDWLCRTAEEFGEDSETDSQDSQVPNTPSPVRLPVWGSGCYRSSQIAYRRAQNGCVRRGFTVPDSTCGARWGLGRQATKMSLPDTPERDTSQRRSAPQSPVLCAVRRIAPAPAAARQGGAFGGGGGTFAMRRLAKTLPTNADTASPPRKARKVPAHELPVPVGEAALLPGAQEEGLPTGGHSEGGWETERMGGEAVRASSAEIAKTIPHSAAPLPLTEEERVFLISASMEDVCLPDFCLEASYLPTHPPTPCCAHL